MSSFVINDLEKFRIIDHCFGRKSEVHLLDDLQGKIEA